MTKVKANKAFEALVEALVVQFGGRMIETTMVVGGKSTKVRRSEGGLFDLDTCRGLLMNAITTNKAEILSKALPASFAPGAVAPKKEDAPVPPESDEEREDALAELAADLGAGVTA